MNTVVEIQKALNALVEKMTDKGVSLPNASLTVKANGEKPYVYLVSDYGSKTFGNSYSHVVHGPTIAAAFKQANKVIDALLDPDEAVEREYLGRVADAIDFGTKHSLDEKYVAPLRGVKKAMTDNLLTKEATE